MKTTFAEEYIRNSNLCQVQISDILKAMDGENFSLNLSSSDSESVYLALKTGIDSHLEACYVPSRGDRFEWSKGRLSGEISPESMPTLLRRLFESDDENAWSLADSILTVLGFDDYGRFVGRGYGTNRELDQRIETWINRNVGPCQSSLVDALIQADFDGFGIDDLQGMYADPSDWDADQCYEYADDNGIDLENDPRKMTREDMLEEIASGDDLKLEGTDDELRERIVDDNLEGWKDQIRDWSQDNPNDPLEWWVVDSWLAGKLLEMGEVIIDNDYGYWWGRTCSGQAIALDGTFYRLFELMGWDK